MNNDSESADRRRSTKHLKNGIGEEKSMTEKWEEEFEKYMENLLQMKLETEKKLAWFLERERSELGDVGAFIILYCK